MFCSAMYASAKRSGATSLNFSLKVEFLTSPSSATTWGAVRARAASAVP